MRAHHVGISPHLASLLTGISEDQLPSPLTVADLPSRYGVAVGHRSDEIPLEHPRNWHRLQCRRCGQWGDYEVGLIMIPQRPKHRSAKPRQPERLEGGHLCAGCTGYFRCEHCNGADWELSDDLERPTVLERITAAGLSFEKRTFAVGKLTMHDGFTPRWATEAEEHFLDIMQKTGEDAYLWNRLGNVYRTGDRPELAMVAYERSLLLDPGMVESLFSIGLLLIDIDQPIAAGQHFRDALFYARNYHCMPREKLRELISKSVKYLLALHLKYPDAIPLPPVVEGLKSSTKNAALKELRTGLNRPETLGPLVDLLLAAKAATPASQGKGLSPALKVRPNDPCPCNSGKKYKKCCGA
ncbi:MAG: SEC-C metal-binding domain-containing protein [Firmicutes bacterium]|nr:SEC-C metal-binding domain-containing protein [Bacillota bacterium]MCL5063961.1 SEC-C metal-binding domain-containing protein [Bacillota bacterium]